MILVIVSVGIGGLLLALAAVALAGWYYQDVQPDIPWWKRWIL